MYNAHDIFTGLLPRHKSTCFPHEYDTFLVCCECLGPKCAGYRVTQACWITYTFVLSSLCDSNMENIYLSNLNESNIFAPPDKLKYYIFTPKSS